MSDITVIVLALIIAASNIVSFMVGARIMYHAATKTPISFAQQWRKRRDQESP